MLLKYEGDVINAVHATHVIYSQHLRVLVKLLHYKLDFSFAPTRGCLDAQLTVLSQLTSANIFLFFLC